VYGSVKSVVEQKKEDPIPLWAWLVASLAAVAIITLIIVSISDPAVQDTTDQSTQILT